MNLDQHPFLAGLPSGDAKKLLKIGKQQSYEAGQVIFDEAADSDSLILLLEGEVEFSKRVGAGRFQVVNKTSAGSFFGELGILTGEPRSLRATALESPTVIFRIPGKGLVKFMDETSPSVSQIVQNLVQHLHGATEKYISDVVEKERMAMVGEMAESIVHDLRNPLSIIDMAAHVLGDEHNDSKSARMVERIRQQVQLSVRLANDLLAFARKDQYIQKGPVRLVEIGEELAQLNDLLFENNRVTFTHDLPEASIQADKNALLRAFQNLLNYCLDSLQGRGEGRIELKGEVRGQGAHLELKDNGAGMDDAALSRFFLPIDKEAYKLRVRLGPAIAKSLVNEHGGSISVKSFPGEGTQFFIKLPTQ